MATTPINVTPPIQNDRTNSLTIRQPDDFHCHFRDGVLLKIVAPVSARVFARATAMPNLQPPIRTVAEAAAYRERIRAAGFPEPLMTLYLTQNTTPAEIEEAAATDWMIGGKLYPAGATTNSDEGIPDVFAARRVFAAMEKYQLPLLIHGEDPCPTIPLYKREQVFVRTTFTALRYGYPDLKMVLEHLSTRDAVDAVRKYHKEFGQGRTAGTITPHHLFLTFNDVAGNPHHFCYPIAKEHSDREAVLEAATSGQICFFAGTDSAPHFRESKEKGQKRPGGIWSAPYALRLYATAFDEADQLPRLENFTSRIGAEFFDLPLNQGTITLCRTRPTDSNRLNRILGEGVIQPFILEGTPTFDF